MSDFEVGFNIIFLCLATRSLYHIFSIIIILRWLSSDTTSQIYRPLGECRRLHLVVAVYREELLIKQTIDALMTIIHGYDSVSLTIVGTMRERNSSGCNHTLCLAEEHVSQNNYSRVRIFESNDVLGKKADQLNQFLLQNDFTNNDWILFLDIDSRIEPRTIEEVVAAISDETEIMQIHSAFMLNFSQLHYWQRGQALYQTRWTIVHEITRLFFARKLGWFVGHVVGHGLCIKFSTLSSVGLFPTGTDIEDVQLGYNLICRNKKIRSLRSLELADNSITVCDGLRQEFSWSFGPLQYFVFRQQFLDTQQHVQIGQRLHSWVVSALGFMGYVGWIIQGPIILGSIVGMLSSSASATVFLISYSLEHILVGEFLVQRRFLSRMTFYRSVPAIMLEWLRRSFPAILAGVYFLTNGKGLRLKTQHLNLQN